QVTAAPDRRLRTRAAGRRDDADAGAGPCRIVARSRTYERPPRQHARFGRRARGIRRPRPGGHRPPSSGGHAAADENQAELTLGPPKVSRSPTMFRRLRPFAISKPIAIVITSIAWRVSRVSPNPRSPP